ncbi:MAG TPA: DUF3152 domain-containing protein [Actinomycetales bacterium]|nr:DUF3152 domain-containing protein [Actinomycetales bacterium]
MALLAAVAMGGFGAAGFLGAEALNANAAQLHAAAQAQPAPATLSATSARAAFHEAAGPDTAAALAPLGPALAGVAPDEPAQDSREALAQLAPALEAAEQFDAELRDQLLSATGGVEVDEVEFTGSGVFTVVPGSMEAPHPERRIFTLAIRVEDGIGIDPDTFTEQVFDILNDPRGWGEIDGVSFARTDDPAAANATLTIASPASTEMLCGELPTRGYTSCGRVGAVNINAARWAHNADAFMAAGGSDEEYRAYLINHEVGHLLDHWHVHCGDEGQLAPVMLQQTLTLQGCVPNGWPNP